MLVCSILCVHACVYVSVFLVLFGCRSLPFKITSDEMYDIFGKYGAIRQIRMYAQHLHAYHSSAHPCYCTHRPIHLTH